MNSASFLSEGSVSSDQPPADAMQLALNHVQAIYRVAQEIGHSDMIRDCQAALGISVREDPRETLKPAPSSRFTLSFRDNAPKYNQSLRFGPALSPVATDRRRFSWQGTKSKSLFSSVSEHDYEEVFDEDTLRAPIVNVCIIHKSDPVPDGYFRLGRTVSGRRADLCTGAGGHTVYLCIQKDTTGTQAPVTALTVIFPDRNETVPPGFLVARRNDQPYDLNVGTNATQRIYLCYKKGEGNPIIDLQVVFPGKGEQCPASFSLIDRTPSGRNADLNANTGGAPILLAYRQSVINVHALSNDERTEPERRRSYSSQDMMKLQITPEHRQRPHSHSNKPGIPHMDIPPPPPGSPPPPPPPPLATAGSQHFTPLPESDSDSGTAALSGASQNADTQSSGEANRVDGTASEDARQHDMFDDIESVTSFATTRRGRRYEDVIVYPDGTIPPAQVRIVLKPILGALYVRQSAFAQLAVDALVALVRQSNFFRRDISTHAPIGFKTMLDLTIECICERLDNVLEHEFEGLLSLLRVVIRYTEGHLSPLSLHLTFRAILFAITCISTRQGWLLKDLDSPFDSGTSESHVIDALDTLLIVIMKKTAILPAPSHLPSIGSERHLTSGNRSPRTPNLELQNGAEANQVIGAIVDDVINDAVESFELSRITEAILATVSKHASLIASESLWNDLVEKSRMLFDDSTQRHAFVVLAALCKLTSAKIRSTNKGEAVPRDLGNKLAALSALNTFLSNCSESLKHSKVFGYLVRRLVVPSILTNIGYAVFERRVYKRLLKLLFTLWRQFRSHLKLELAILFDSLMLKMLNANLAQVRPLHRQIVCEELAIWFTAPHHPVELFLNFDMDRSLVSQFDLFRVICEGVCTLSEHAFRRSIGVQTSDDGVKAMYVSALRCATQIGKAIMDAAGHAHLIARDVTLSRVDEDNVVVRVGDGQSKRRARSGSILQRREARKANEQLLKQGLKIYKEKSLKKAMQFWIAQNFIGMSPQDVASFLRLYKDVLDPESIGEYLSEGGTSRDADDWDALRYRFTRAISFNDMDVEVALRHFLTNSGFKAPGESQRIDRLLVAFAKCFWEDNSGTPACPFSNRDTPYLLAYAIIILNTDLHKANLDPRKKRRQMTKDAFVNNLRGVDDNQDLNKAFLEKVYDNVKMKPIELATQDDATSSHGDSLTRGEEPNDPQAALRFVRAMARGVKQNEELLRALSAYSRRFALVGRDVSMSMELVGFMFEATWFHFHGVVDYLLTQVASLEVTTTCLDLLRYLLSATIFLNLNTERAVFATQLARFKFIAEAKQNGRQPSEASTYIATGKHKQEVWYQRIETAGPDNALEIIEDLHRMMLSLREGIHRESKQEELVAVAARIEKKAHLLDGARTFLKEGDLVKHNRSGKTKLYRFFLFSDHMIYTHLSKVLNEYKVHERLPLLTMKFADVPEDTSQCAFRILHPKKSFMVQAASRADKVSWLTAIQTAVANAQRKGPVERRLSLLPRLETLTAHDFEDDDGHARDTPGRGEEQSGDDDEDDDDCMIPSRISIYHRDDESDRSAEARSGASNHDSSHAGDDASDDSSLFTESVCAELPSDTKLIPPGAAWAAVANPSSRSETPDHTPSPNIATFMATLAPLAPPPGRSASPAPNALAAPPRREPTSPVPPTVHDGVEHKIALFRESLQSLTEKELNKLFVRGVKAWMVILDDEPSDVDDDIKLQLYGLYKQAKAGAPPSLEECQEREGSVGFEKLLAWHKFRHLGKMAAKKQFLVQLTELDPDWQED